MLLLKKIKIYIILFLLSSDVSAYQNEHTVIEDQNRILSTTQNEDGTTTYMVSTESGEEINQYDGKTVFFLRLPDNNEENS